MAFPQRNRRARARAPRALAALAGPAALLWLGLGCNSGDESRRDSGPPPVTVEVVRVEPELLLDVESFGGQLMAENSVMLKSETDGVVASIEFAEGQRVEEGDILIRLQNVEQEARMAVAHASLALAREEFNRTARLSEHNAVSKAAHSRTTAELEIAKTRVDLAQIELDRTRIGAPFAGAVGLRLVSIGERVTDDTPLVQLDAVDRLQLIFPTSEHGVAFAKIGTPIQATVRPYPGEKFGGEVFFIAPTVDPETRRLYIKAWMPNEDGRLRPGLYANLDMEIARRENAIVVPEAAIVYDRRGTYVWRVDENDEVERVPVELGLRKGGRVEVVLGLRAGDDIVSAGTHKVSEGRVVRRKGRSTDHAAYRKPASDEEPGEGT